VIVKILGSAAGGGFPQWNCNCRNCRAVRVGSPGFVARTQASLAVSSDGGEWLLLNASPDLREQIAATSVLSPDPDGPARASPIAAVALVNGDVDAVAGLLHLREAQAFALFAGPHVLETLAANRIFDVLDATKVARRALPLGELVAVTSGLAVEAFAVPGKVALYLESSNAFDLGTRPGDTIGLKVSQPATGAHFFYIPACARMEPDLAARLTDTALVMFDGTLWRDDEMLAQNLMAKTGARMGHMNMSGPQGSIAAFDGLGVKRKVFVHINNSNPALDAGSIERAVAERAGWTIGEDGMEFRL
jgi:pyrroloquinoline quinone biosynthesis protein B